MISLILAKKILSLFLVMALGIVLVRCGIVRSQDSKVLSMISLYLVMPCVIISSFQVEYQPEILNGLLLALAASALLHLVLIVVVGFLGKVLKLDGVEETSLIYSNAGNLIIPIVTAILGKEWVIYTSAFLSVQLFLLWIHASFARARWQVIDLKKILTNINMIAIFAGVLLFLLKVLGILLLVVLALMVLLLLIPFCADVSWEQDTLTVKAGALGITFPVFQYPKPEPTEESKRKKKPKKAKAAKKPAKEKKPAEPRKKAKLTLNILCTILRGAGTLIRAVFGALRITHIRVCLGVRGEDPAAAARNYGKLQAWLYPVLGVLDRFIYLQFDELRIVPDFGSAEPAVEDRVSLRISARALFIVVAAVRVLAEFWREKVLDVFL